MLKRRDFLKSAAVVAGAGLLPRAVAQPGFDDGR